MSQRNPIRVVTFPQRERVEVVERARDGSPPGADEVEGPTLVSLVSPGTEINLQLLGERFPSDPGYTAVFRVEAVGQDAKGLEPGDLALCSGPAGVGGHRSWQRVPAAMAVAVPEGLEPAAAAHARLAAVSMSTLATTPARPPGPVLITGLGPVGHLVAQVFRGCGYRVTGVDPIHSRRELLRGKGVDDVREAAPIRADSPDPAGLGYGLAVECSAHEAAALACLRAIRVGGEVVQLGAPHSQRAQVSAHELLHAVYRAHARLRSGWEWQLPRTDEAWRPGSVVGNMRTALDWLAEGRLDVAGLYETADPADAPAVYDHLRTRPQEAFSVAFDWQT